MEHLRRILPIVCEQVNGVPWYLNKSYVVYEYSNFMVKNLQRSKSTELQQRGKIYRKIFILLSHCMVGDKDIPRPILLETLRKPFNSLSSNLPRIKLYTMQNSSIEPIKSRRDLDKYAMYSVINQNNVLLKKLLPLVKIQENLVLYCLSYKNYSALKMFDEQTIAKSVGNLPIPLYTPEQMPKFYIDWDMYPYQILESVIFHIDNFLNGYRFTWSLREITEKLHSIDCTSPEFTFDRQHLKILDSPFKNGISLHQSGFIFKKFGSLNSGLFKDFVAEVILKLDPIDMNGVNYRHAQDLPYV